MGFILRIAAVLVLLFTTGAAQAQSFNNDRGIAADELPVPLLPAGF